MAQRSINNTTSTGVLMGVLCALLWCGFGATGCASSKKQTDQSILKQYVPPGQTEMRVKTLEISGMEILDEDELRGGLATKEDPGWRTWSWISWIPLLGTEKIYFNEVAWRQDQARIKTWLASKGYFNATIATSSKKSKDGKWISLYVKIREQQPVKVRAIKIVGLQNTRMSTNNFELPIKVNGLFSQENYLKAKAQIRKTLRQKSYAYASVQGTVVVDPKTQRATVTFFVDSGPRTYIRKITIKGLKDVTSSYVEDAVTLKKGQLYSDNALLKTQENIYELGVFSLVTVQPAFEVIDEKKTAKNATEQPKREATQQELKAGEIGPLGISDLTRRAQLEAERRYGLDPNIDVIIQVKEAKKLSIRLGTGFSVESTRQDVHLSANWASRNLFDSLLRLEHFNTFGYAITPGLIGLASEGDDMGDVTFGQRIERIEEGIGNNGFFFDSQLSMTKPQFITRELTGFAIARVQREVQLGYLGLSPSMSLGLRHKFFEHLQVEATYSLLYYQYQSLDAGFRQRLIEQELIRAGDDTPSQFLESFEQRIAWDRRNNILNPTSGYMIELFLQQAGDFVAGGNFSYLKPRLSIEGYVPYDFGTKWVTAMRGRVGSIYNLNDTDNAGNTRGIPVQSRFFAGGRNSMRSFGTRFLSPFTSNTLMVDPDTFDPVPVGGTTLLEASVEQRARVYKNLLSLGDVWAALYVDAATVLDEPLWVDTDANSDPVADLSRLNDTLLYALGGGVWWLTPVGPVRFDLAFTLNDIQNHPNFQSAQVRQKILGYNFYLGIGHSF